MRFGDLLRSSLGSLWQRKFRTTLTVTGVVVGTMAVVVMISLGVGMSQAQLESIERNANLRQITVYSAPADDAVPGGPAMGDPGMGPGGGGGILDDAQVAELAELPGVVAAWPTYSVSAELDIAGTEMFVQITGVPHGMLESLDVEFASGEIPVEQAPLALVFGDKVGEMGMVWSDDPNGQPEPIDFSTQPTFVTFTEGDGFPGPRPGDEEADPGATPPKKFVIPTAAVIAGEEQQWGPHSTMVYADLDALLRTLEEAFPGKALPGQPATSSGKPVPYFVYNQIVLQVEDVAAAEALTTQLRGDGYMINSDLEWMREVQSQAALIQAALGGIGFISLLVAAIGIANTMLMSVYERTREIGIMKVLGAALGDIRRMFLVESASIGFFGGLVGLVLSLAVSAGINSFASGMNPLGMEAKISVIPVWLMLGAVGFSTAIGTLAGIIPAQRAMRLSALAAIRTQ